MKKIFLLGTMLGVASAALAFGGVFGGGGHKSTTYKGGVDAIGVHFGGEKKKAATEDKEVPVICEDPQVLNEATNECECPAEKQCGDYCCQGDNVCKQDPDSGELQCCSERLNYCCPNNQGVYSTYRAECCSGKLYCTARDTDGNCIGEYQCCSAENKVFGPLERTNGEQIYKCCESEDLIYCSSKHSYGCNWNCCSFGSAGVIYKGQGMDGADLCCFKDQAPVCSRWDEQNNCVRLFCGDCSEGETPYASSGRGGAYCCPSDKVVSSFHNGEHTYNMCCYPNETPYCRAKYSYGCSEDCCSGSVYEGVGMDGADLCCTEGQEFSCAQFDGENKCLIGSCCSDGEESVCAEYDENGKCILAVCCPSSSIGVSSYNSECCEQGTELLEDSDGRTHCCPSGLINVSTDGECCEPGTQLTEAPDGETHCCPEGSVGYSHNDGCCEPGTILIEDQDGETQCCPEGTVGLSGDGECCGPETILLEGPEGNRCCPTGSTDISTGDGECCGHDETVAFEANGETWCCPADSTGWSGADGCCEAGTTVVEDPDGDTHCCPTEFFDEGNWECCPEGTTGWNEEDGCIQ